MGLTAAAIHHRATGKRTLLEVARKNADYLYGVFQPRPKHLAHFCFNPSQIMGLTEPTGPPGKRHLELAGIFVGMRGSQPGGPTVIRRALLEAGVQRWDTVVGPYLWAGAADVYMETGEPALRDALCRLWNNVVNQKMYVTARSAHQSAPNTRTW
jgi:DUF1680 family protein